MLYLSKIRVHLLSLLCVSPFLIYAQQSPASAQSPTFHYYGPKNQNKPTMTANVNPKVIVHTTSIINAIGIKIGDVLLSIHQMVQDKVTQKNYERLRDLVKELLWQNRYKITGSIVLGSYGASSALLLADYYRAHDMFWVHWKKQLTFEDLCAISQKELARQLMLAIGQHNFNKANPTDLASPLIDFIKEIEFEITILKRYIATVKTIKYLHLMLLFPTNDNKLARATTMLQRVLFVKHIFLSWLADYNLTSAEKLNE